MIIDEQWCQPGQVTGSQRRNAYGDHCEHDAVSGPHQSDQQAAQCHKVANEPVGNEGR